MPFGYVGTVPNQQVQNSGVFSVTEQLKLSSDKNLGSALQFIDEKNPTNSSAVDFTSIKQSRYSVHLIHANLSYDGTADTNYSHYMRVITSGGVQSGTDYKFAGKNLKSENSTDNDRNQGSGTYWDLEGAQDRAAHYSNFYIYVYGAGDSSKTTQFTYHKVSHISTERGRYLYSGGKYDQNSEVTGFRIYPATGATLSGNLKLYGLVQ